MTVVPDVLTVGQVAALLALRPDSVRDLIRAGELRALRLGRGGAYRIPIPAYREFLHGRRVVPEEN